MNTVQTSDPIVYANGEILFNDQFKADPKFAAVIPLLERSRDHAQDLGSYLFFVYCPKSIYNKFPIKDRFRMMVADKRLRDKAWLISLARTDQVKELVEQYCDLVLTPGQRLHNGLMENIKRLLDEISKVKGGDDVDFGKLVKKGTDLFDVMKSVEKMLSDEQGAKVKGGYEPNYLERRPTHMEVAR